MFFKDASSGENKWYMPLLTLFIVFVAYGLGQLPLSIVGYYQISNNNNITTDDVELFHETLDFSLIDVHSNLGLLLMLIPFITATLAFMLCLKHMHRRPFLNVITPNERINWAKIKFAFVFWFVLAVAMEVVSAMVNPEAYYFNFKPLSFIFLVAICVLILPIQTSFEEFLLRGYIMPFIGWISKNKWVALIGSSLFFGLIHGMNPEVEKFGSGIMMTYYIMAGLFLGLITILDDSLELALGVHAATNIFGAALFSFDGSVLQTDSLFKASSVNPYIMTLSFFIGACIFIAVCWHKYKWSMDILNYEKHEVGDRTDNAKIISIHEDIL